MQEDSIASSITINAKEGISVRKVLWSRISSDKAQKYDRVRLSRSSFQTRSIG